MSQVAVLYSQIARTPGRGHGVRRADAATPAVDPIRVLSEAVQRPDSPLYRLPGTPAQRPFDAQYWACWVVAAVVPALVAYLGMTG